MIRTMFHRKPVPSTPTTSNGPRRLTSHPSTVRTVFSRPCPGRAKLAKSCSPTSAAPAARIAATSSGVLTCQLVARRNGEGVGLFQIR